MGGGKLVADARPRECRRRCAFSSSIPRRTCCPTTTRWPPRWRAAGADVELVTSRFVHGPAPPPDGYAVQRGLLPAGHRARGAAARACAARSRSPSTCPTCCAAAAAPADADVSHWQWLWLEALSARLLPRERPQVLTMHNVIRRERSARRARSTRMDAVDRAHPRTAPSCSAAGERVHVIPHGAFEHLTRQPDERPLPPELAAVEGPVVLCFGVVRAVQGRGRAGRGLPRRAGARAVGRGAPARRVDRAAATARAAGSVRFVDRYVADAELPAFFRRADLLVLPAPQRRRVRRAVRRPRLRQGDGALRRRRLSRAGRGRTARAGWCRRATRRRSRAAIGELLADPAERARARASARARGRGGPLLLGPDRRAHPRASTTRCWRVRVVFMGKSKRSAARALDWLVGAGLRGGGGGGLRARPLDPRRAARRPRGEPPRAAAGRARPSSTRDPPGGRGRGGLVPVLEADPRAADLARADRLPQLPPRAAARLPRPRRLQRGDPRGPAPSGACPATSSTSASTPATWWRSSASPIDQRRRDGLLARPAEPGAAARRCSSG